MKDDLVERLARAIMENRTDHPRCLVTNWRGESADNPHVAQALRQARAVLAIARPAIRKEALEEAAKVAEAHRPGWLSVNTAHLKQQADHIATAIRALSTTGER